MGMAGRLVICLNFNVLPQSLHLIQHEVHVLLTHQLVDTCQDTLQLFKTSGEGRKGTDQSKHSQHFRAILLRRCGCGLAYNRMWVWFRTHAHKNYTN